MRHLPIAAFVIAAVASACARKPLTVVDATSGREITLLPSPTPTRCFSGEYQSPHVGRLRLDQAGTEVKGQYLVSDTRPAMLGYVKGRVEGNVAIVEWNEFDAEAPHRLFAGGTGFFYDLPPGQTQARLFGRRQIATQSSGRSGPSLITRDELWTAVALNHAVCAR